MGQPGITVARVAELCARLINRESKTSLKKSMGIGDKTMARAIDVLRKHGVTVEPIPPCRVDQDKRAALFEYFRTTQMSNRQIVAATGFHLKMVNLARRKFNIELINDGGELPKCDCGQYLHHPRMCWARLHQSKKDRGIACVRGLPNDVQADIRRRLIRGETLRAIGDDVGLDRNRICSFLRSFTSEERARRKDCFLVRSAQRRSEACRQKIANRHATNPMADPMYARIARAVPRAIDRALRDDMISQAYLEYLEKKLDPKRLSEGVKKVRGRVFQQFANPWGNRSIDVSLDGEDGASFADLIPDERALLAFEAIG
jgi:hypothetical protein